ncbi:hypothetical protein [uncultured Desulfobacter sp.]|uniref:hypothetical protein n=1 Tax=uncultured Desulfobacter sp. TaxID=240139 RepID=UPI002AA83D06|nr:hypothetical protein [uncultured Desulfobacter sp.]
MADTALKEKVSGLEQMMMELAYESMKTDMAVRDLASEMKDFKNEMKDFKDEMKDFKDEMKDFKDEMKDFKDEMKDFKDEMKDERKDFKQEMKDFKDELRNDTKQFKKELNKKWGDLANKMGTIVEDIVAPGLKGVGARYFGIEEFDFFAPRLRLKSRDRSMTREFDVIAETEKYFFVVETKSAPTTEYISDFIKLIPRLDSWFPVIREKKLIPVFASLLIPDELVRYLTKNNILAMASQEDGMELFNSEILEKLCADV